jgi:hypothetical protein
VFVCEAYDSDDSEVSAVLLLDDIEAAREPPEQS